MNPVSFEVSVRRWASICLQCGEPCEAGDDLIHLDLGHVMHVGCYDRWIAAEEAQTPNHKDRPQASGIVQVLPGETYLTRDQIAQRRHDLLYGRKKRFDAGEAGPCSYAEPVASGGATASNLKR